MLDTLIWTIEHEELDQGLPCGFLGLSESEIERYGASFVRFKDPDGPEMHKARWPVLPDISRACLGFWAYNFGKDEGTHVQQEQHLQTGDSIAAFY